MPHEQPTSGDGQLQGLNSPSPLSVSINLVNQNMICNIDHDLDEADTNNQLQCFELESVP